VPGTLTAEPLSVEAARSGAASSDTASRPVSRQSGTSRPTLNPINTQAESVTMEPITQTPTQLPSQRTASNPATSSSNWRRAAPLSSTSVSTASQPTSTLDWASAGKARQEPVASNSAYQRKDTGIKVLKPKSASRTFSSTSTATSTASPADGRSRFFDDGIRRSGGPDAGTASAVVTSSSPASATPAGGNLAPPKTRSNPVGGASAFSWLNSGGLGK
jgi:hypothetical protein